MGEVKAQQVSEEVSGNVQCNNCSYWGIMTGYVSFEKPGLIQFVCPECEAIERVSNPF